MQVQTIDIALLGLPAGSHEWVTLLKLNTAEEASSAVRRCHSKTQPYPNRLHINWDHFAAFKADEVHTPVR